MKNIVIQFNIDCLQHKYSHLFSDDIYLNSNSSPEETRAFTNYKNSRRKYKDDESIIINALDRGSKSAIMFYMLDRELRRTIDEEVKAAVLRTGGEWKD